MKTVMDHIKGPEKRQNINAKIPCSLYSAVLKQINIDKALGYPVTFSALIRAAFQSYLEERQAPNLKDKIHKLKKEKGL